MTADKEDRARLKAERARIKTERVRDKLEARTRRDRQREEIADRDELFATLAEHTRTVEASWNGLSFMVDTGDRGIGRMLFSQRRRPEFEVLERTLELLRSAGAAIDTSRSVFLDIGANIGTASLAAVHQHGFSRAIACEPNPRSQQLMRMSLVRNGLEDRVIPVPEAISDRSGTAHLLTDAESPGRDRLSDEGAHEGTVAVPMSTVDEVLARLGVAPDEVGLMWIDTQGHEAEVLKGAASLLERRCPVVFEFWPGALRARETFAALQEAVSGYDTFIELRAAMKDQSADVSLLKTDIATVTAFIDGLEKAGNHTDLLAF
jgi:FkbM family methyltransferase